jgi:hypothetical protein
MPDQFPIIIAANPHTRQAISSLYRIFSVFLGVVGVAGLFIFFKMANDEHMAEFRIIIYAIITALLGLIYVCMKYALQGNLKAGSERTRGREIEIHADRGKVAKHLDRHVPPEPSDDADYFILPMAQITNISLVRGHVADFWPALNPMRRFGRFYKIQARRRFIMIAQADLGAGEQKLVNGFAQLGFKTRREFDPLVPGDL